MSRVHSVKVVRMALDEPPSPLRVEERYGHVLLIVTLAGEVVGELLLAAGRGHLSEDPPDAAASELGERISRRRLAAAFRRATQTESKLHGRPDPTVSAVICTRDRPEQLRRCLESVFALAPGAHEVLVVDSAPADDSAERVCAGYPVRYMRQPAPGVSHARNRGVAEARGELVAFTDDDCVVDPRWLHQLGDSFADPLVMAVAGYVGPLELETPAQWLFHARAAAGRAMDPTVVGCWSRSRPRVLGENLIVRRRAFDAVGLFAEDLGPGSLAEAGHDDDLGYRLIAAGHRIRHDPARIVWHRHPSTFRELRARSWRRAGGAAAYATRSALHRHDARAVPAALRPVGRLGRDLRPGHGGGVGALALDLLELMASLTGPWRFLLTTTRRREAGRSPHAPSSAERPLQASTRVAVSELPPLSVAIASRNRGHLLARVLQEGLGSQAYPPDRFEAVVVLDGSTDRSAEMVRSLDMPYRVRLIEQQHRGLGATRNRGAREATAPVVVFLDDDVIPEPSFLAVHAEAHARARDDHFALGYTPPVIRESGLWSVAIHEWWEDYFRRRREPNHQWTFADVADGNSSIPRSLFLGCGGFEESLERRHDWEFGIRLLKGGVRMAHYHEACGSHYFDTSFAAALRNRRLEGRADVPFVEKHPEVLGRLAIAVLAGMEREDMSTRHLLAYRHPGAGECLARRALPLLRALEVARLRSQWHRLSTMLLVHCYLLGVVDVLPSLEDFRAFVMRSRSRGGQQAVAVALGEAGTFQAPPGCVGPFELELRVGGAAVATLAAVEPGRQWDWEALSARVVDEASAEFRRVGLDVTHGNELSVAKAEMELCS